MAMLNLRLARAGGADRHRAHCRARISATHGDKVEVGAAVTQNRLLAWPELREKLPLLAAALPFVGHFQTRNNGTVCGSIAHADPSSEIPLALATLDGEVVLRSRARHARARGARLPARHADDRARARRADRRGALSGPRRRARGVPRGRAPARRFRHGRGRGVVDGRRQRQARRRRRGRPAGGAAHCLDVVRLGKDAIEHSAWELEGYDDMHASARMRRDLLRRLGPAGHRGGAAMRRVNKDERTRIA